LQALIYLGPEKRDGPGEENEGRSWEKRMRDGPERRE